MQSISASAAKQNFGALLSQAAVAPVSIERHGRAEAIMCSPSLFAGVDPLETELYFADSSERSERSLHFVYGTIRERRGWITQEMLTPARDLGELDADHPCRPERAGLPADP